MHQLRGETLFQHQSIRQDLEIDRAVIYRQASFQKHLINIADTN